MNTIKQFCEQWYVVQSTAMNAMFKLLGELSLQQTIAIRDKDILLFERVTKMRNMIVAVVVDETNLTHRTSGYDTVFHNDLFLLSAKEAGVDIKIEEIESLPSVQEFMEVVSSLSDYESLFAFLRATENEAEDIFERMRALFDSFGAPKSAYKYIEVHEKIESFHNDESKDAQEDLKIEQSLVDTYTGLWNKVLADLSLK